MKHIKTYNDYINEGWFSDKMKSLATGAKAVVSTFNQSFSKMVDDVKKTWVDVKNQEEIKVKFIKILETAYNTAIVNIDKIKTEEELIQILDDMKQSIVHLKETITKELTELANVKESVVNESAIDLKYTLSGLLTSVSKALADFKDSYVSELQKQKDFNEKRTKAKELLKAEFNKVKTEIENMNIKDLINQEKSNDNVEPDMEYIAGTILTYRKKDGTQATGVVARDQSEAEEGYVAMTTLDRRSNFAVPKNRIIGKVKVNQDKINWNNVDKQDPKSMNKAVKDYFQFTKGLDDPDKLSKIIDILKNK